MTDDDTGAGENGGSEERPAAASTPDPHLEIDMHYVESLPGGRAVMALEEEGRFAWFVVRGHVSPQARTEMLSDLRHIVGSGLWVQNWQPPQAGS